MFAKTLRSISHHTSYSRYASTAVLAWGNGAKVSLGINGAGAELSPRRVLSLDKYNVVSVSAGEVHSAVLTDDGRVLTFGKGKYGVLGHGNEADQTEPKIVEALNGVPIVQIECGLYHTAALSADGDVFTWGWGGSFMSGQGALGLGDSEQQLSPCLIESLSDEGEKIVKIACGSQHVVALSNKNVGYAWGSGEKGKLGDGNVSDSTVPLELDAFPDAAGKLVDIAAGGTFSFSIMDKPRHVYGWGDNSASQLGLPVGFDIQNAMESFPALLTGASPFNDKTFANQLFAGSDSAMALTSSGGVYVWGGKLWAEPHEMETLRGLKAVTGSVGKRNQAIITDKGALYTWGKGRSMALGHGDKRARTVPKKLDTFKSDVTDGALFKSISMGTNHALSVVEYH